MRLARIVYTPTARHFIKHLHPDLKKPLRECIEELAASPLAGKPLQDELEGFRSHRLKAYRVIYRYLDSKHTVEVLFAGQRRDVYRLFLEHLRTHQA